MYELLLPKGILSSLYDLLYILGYAYFLIFCQYLT
jgi:hypothetical protein